MRRGRRRPDELEHDRRPSLDVDAERQRGLAGEALRLQELETYGFTFADVEFEYGEEKK